MVLGEMIVPTGRVQGFRGLLCRGVRALAESTELLLVAMLPLLALLWVDLLVLLHLILVLLLLLQLLRLLVAVVE